MSLLMAEADRLEKRNKEDKARRHNSQEEYLTQKGLIEVCRMQLNSYPELKTLYAVPNGANVGQEFNHSTGIYESRERQKLVSSGLKPGVFDLCLPISRCGYGSLYLETKSNKGRLSTEQKAWALLMHNAGNCCFVYRDIEHGWHLLRWYLKSNADLVHDMHKKCLQEAGHHEVN